MATPPKAAKTVRREQLESSLRELQGDIARLSEKLTGSISISASSPLRPRHHTAKPSSKNVSITLTPRQFSAVANGMLPISSDENEQASSASEAPTAPVDAGAPGSDIVTMILEKAPNLNEAGSSSPPKPPPAAKGFSEACSPPSPPSSARPLDLANFSLPSSVASSPPSLRYSSPVGLSGSQSAINEHSSTPKIQRILAEIAAQRDKNIEKVKMLQKENLELRSELHEVGGVVVL